MPFALWLLHQAMRGRLRQWRRDLDAPWAAQARRLADILHANRDTEFGRAHGFGGLVDRHAPGGRAAFDRARARAFADDYRARVPIRGYEGFADAVARMEAGEHNLLVAQPPVMYNATSGSSSRPKHCPVNRRFVVEHHRAHLIWLYHFLRDHPGMAAGPVLTLVSPAVAGRAPDGTPIGSSSGRQAGDQSWLVRRRQVVPYAAFTVADYAARHHAILVHALGRSLAAAVAVNPSSLAFLGGVLAERAEALLDDVAAGRLAHAPRPEGPRADHDAAVLAALAARLRPAPARARALRARLRADGRLTPAAAWPRLAAIATWQGGSAPFYARRVRQTWGGAPMRCLGLRASEGTFTIPLADDSPSGVLAVGGAFLEFLPGDADPAPDAPTRLAHELERGRRYRLVFTSSGGFYRYDLADVVEVTGWRGATPEAAFLHRAGGVLSITGEKVTEAQVVAAMRPVQARWPDLAGFAVTLELPDGAPAGASRAVPRYVLALEWAPGAEADPEGAARRFDAALGEGNPEYADKRAGGRLAPAIALTVAPGGFARQRRAMVEAGRPDGQVKPPHLFAPAGPGPAPVRPCPFFDHVEVAARGG